MLLTREQLQIPGFKEPRTVAELIQEISAKQKEYDVAKKTLE